VGLINPIAQCRTEDRAKPVSDTTSDIVGELRSVGIGEHGDRRATTIGLDQKFYS